MNTCEKRTFGDEVGCFPDQTGCVFDTDEGAVRWNGRVDKEVAQWPVRPCIAHMLDNASQVLTRSLCL